MPVYQSPAAMAQVLGADQNAETAEMFAQKMMGQGMSSLMMGQGIPAARPIPVQAQEEGQGFPWPPSQEEKEVFTKEAESLLPEGAGLPWNMPPYTWEIHFADEPVPWHPEITFGEWIYGVRKEHGEEAAQLAIKEMQRVQKENAEAQKVPEIPQEVTPPVPTMPTPPPVEQQVQQQVPPQQVPQQTGQPIMTAQGGGFVNRGTIAGELAPRGIMSAREAGETLHELRKRHDDERNYRGYAHGGLVPRYALGGPNLSEDAQISEQDFMGILSSEASNAGISEEALQTIAQNIPAAAQTATAANDNVMDSGIMETVDVEEAAPETDSGIAQLPALSERLVAMGEEPLVQATPGEIIFDPRLVPEKERGMLFAALEAAGIDPSTITVGGPMPINELTGLPAAGFGSFFKAIAKPFKAIAKGVKKVGKFLKKNAGTILGIAGALTGNPWLAALGSGIGSLIEGKPLKQALLSAGMSFVGTKWVGPWIGKQVGSAITSIPGGTDVATGSLLPGNILAGKTAGAATERAAITAADQAARAAALDAITKGGAEVTQKAMTEAALDAATKAALEHGLTTTAKIGAEAGVETLAKSALDKIATNATSQVLALGQKALAAPLSQQVMSQVASSSVGNLLAQPVSQTLGGIASGALQYAAKPYVEGMFIPPEVDQGGLIEEFEAQYNYTPSSEELYQFYQGSFDPQQVDVAQTIGQLPGYTGIAQQIGSLPTFTAAGGGYIDGVGGPKTDSNLARLSDGEFVMTEKSVRGAGGGDRMKGAAEMYRMMNGYERRVA